MSSRSARLPKPSLTILGVAVVAVLLGVAIFTNAADAGAGQKEEPATGVLVIDSDGCRVIPTSCFGPSPVTAAWASPAGTISISKPGVVRATDATEAIFPTEAFVLVHTPPPQRV